MATILVFQKANVKPKKQIIILYATLSSLEKRIQQLLSHLLFFIPHYKKGKADVYAHTRNTFHKVV